MFIKSASGLAALFLFTSSAQAALLYDQSVTNDVIFGLGNVNGGFAVHQSGTEGRPGGGIELGLRAKLRFDDNNNPQNIFNSNGGGTYTFNTGTPPLGFSFAANAPTTPVWNFEWSINSNFDGSGGVLSEYKYLLLLDGDPTSGTSFSNPMDFASGFDPINVPLLDHAIGNNLTGNGAGTVFDDEASYEAGISSNNLAQNSWSYEFFNGGVLPQLDTFDPNVEGFYTIRLSAFDSSDALVASTSINVNVVAPVPLPASLMLLMSALGLTGLIKRRRA